MSVDDIDKAIRCPVTWCSMAAVLDIALEAEHIGRWCEGCPCHNQGDQKALEDLRKKKRKVEQPRGWTQEIKCPYKGCRAVELASGVGQRSLHERMMRNKEQVLAHFSSVPDEKRSALLTDWDDARGRLWSVLAGGYFVTVAVCS